MSHVLQACTLLGLCQFCYLKPLAMMNYVQVACTEEAMSGVENEEVAYSIDGLDTDSAAQVMPVGFFLGLHDPAFVEQVWGIP